MAKTIRGIQEVQQKMAKLARAAKAEAPVKAVTVAAHRYAASVTHVDTGALKAAHNSRIGGAKGEVFLNPGAVNPKGNRPAVYGFYEHLRGGSHSFYDRTLKEGWSYLEMAAKRAFRSEVGT